MSHLRAKCIVDRAGLVGFGGATARFGWIALLLGTLSASPGLSQTRQFGNTLYSLPEGWMVGSVVDGVQIMHGDETPTVCRRCRMLLPLGEKAEGSLESYLQKTAIRLVEMEDEGEPRVLQNPKISQEGARTIAMMAAQADDLLYIVLATQAGNRFQSLAYRGPGGEPDEAENTLGTFQSQAVPMFLGAKYLSEGAKPLLPAPVAGPLEGVWYGWRTRSTLGIYGMLRQELDHRLMVFWTSGLFYRGSPPQGTQLPDVSELMAAGDLNVGTYRVEAGKLLLELASGETDEMRLDGGTLRVSDDFALQRVTPVADGIVFDGRIESLFATGFFPGVGAGGGMSSLSMSISKKTEHGRPTPFRQLADLPRTRLMAADHHRKAAGRIGCRMGS
ncbi:MAG: hypothetical protein ACK4MS_00140 [Paracoccaceae bacterium]